MNESEAADKFLFVGNQLCLDFINTEVIEDGKRVSLLVTFDDLIDWLTAANLLDAASAAEAKKQWDKKGIGTEVLAKAFDMRTKLREMAGEIIAGKSIEASTLAAINELLKLRQGYEEVVAGATHYHKKFQFTPTQPEHLLIPLAEAASDLLCNADFALIRKCENPACILYFYDTTKNHARRWCSMGGCGNRHKQAAHYRRVQSRKEE